MSLQHFCRASDIFRCCCCVSCLVTFLASQSRIPACIIARTASRTALLPNAWCIETPCAIHAPAQHACRDTPPLAITDVLTCGSQGSAGRHIWKLRRAIGQAPEASAKPAMLQLDARSSHRGRDKQRHAGRHEKGDKRVTQSPDGMVRRVRSKRRHASPETQHRQRRHASLASSGSKADADASVTVSLRESGGKPPPAALPAFCNGAPEVREASHLR